MASVSQAVQCGRTGGAEGLPTRTTPQMTITVLSTAPLQCSSVCLAVARGTVSWAWSALSECGLRVSGPGVPVLLCDSACAVVMLCDLGMLGHSDMMFLWGFHILQFCSILLIRTSIRQLPCHCVVPTLLDTRVASGMKKLFLGVWAESPPMEPCPRAWLSKTTLHVLPLEQSVSSGIRHVDSPGLRAQRLTWQITANTRPTAAILYVGTPCTAFFYSGHLHNSGHSAF